MRLRVPVSAIVAIFTGLVMLFLYFFPAGILADSRLVLLQWVMIVGAFALLVGVFNLIQVHWRKLRTSQPGSFYSLVILAAFGLTLGVVLYEPAGPASVWTFNYILLPVESSLLAVLAIVLAYTCARLLFRRLNAPAVLFAATVVVILLGMAPLFFFPDVPDLINFRTFVMTWLAVGGGRGLLLGVALGTLAVGARILMGIDRPYGG